MSEVPLYQHGHHVGHPTAAVSEQDLKTHPLGGHMRFVLHIPCISYPFLLAAQRTPLRYGEPDREGGRGRAGERERERERGRGREGEKERGGEEKRERGRKGHTRQQQSPP